MKRSQINEALRRMEAFIEEYKISLPDFCNLSPAELKGLGEEYKEVFDNRLGWDITDYGLGDFDEVGFSLITLRNGNHKLSDIYKKPYAEKLLFLKQGQYSPMHFHWYKMEDIINKGGGNVLITVYNSTPDEELDKINDVTVSVDGRKMVVRPGTRIRLKPGQSITITPRLYHDFIVEEGDMDVLLGEVSMTNDDEHDNRFLENVGRFSTIEEDEEPYRLLCNEY